MINIGINAYIFDIIIKIFWMFAFISLLTINKAGGIFWT